MRIAVLGEANTANQGSLTPDVAKQITSAQQAATLYGYGSPLYLMARILFPVNGGDGVGGIPVMVYPQAEPGGATAKVLEVTATGTATGNGTHTLILSGRAGLESVFYNINIENGDTAGDIHAKLEDAVNAVLGSPAIATSTEYESTFTTKWKGLTANEFNISVDTGTDTLGITYSVTSVQNGAGTPSIANALTAFSDEWNTLVVNSYGTEATTVSALEAFNGKPDNTTPTGRYAGIVFKPFVALTGTVADDPTSFSDATARKSQVTIALCPAPLSPGFSFEAAANFCVLQARQSQDAPRLDILNQKLPDMPVPLNGGTIGSMASYNNRDSFVKKGCSTVSLVGGVYTVQDFVTTYHPDGETPPQFRYVRNLVLDWNVKFRYAILEQLYVVGKVLIADGDIVAVGDTVSPKQWKGVLVSQFIPDLVTQGLVVDATFSEASITVALNTGNPDRFDSAFKYKRSGVGRIASTTATAGFNFGVLTV